MTAAESVPPVRRREGAALARVQFARLFDLLDTLSPDEWAAPTDCAGWDVKAIASHVLGGLESAVPREMVRQLRLGARVAREEKLPDRNDGMNAVQVRERAGLSGPDLARLLRERAERLLRHRERTPFLLRYGVWAPLDVAGRKPFAFVIDVIYGRDTLIHRIDVCRATGRDLLLDEVEQRIVADMVREWAARHGEPVTLRLGGPAGGTYECRGGGPPLDLDAVDWVRAVSGRGARAGLLATPVQV
ncbi:MAG TPA: maleylpyruvate isomerase family mycothiol-dependent enzyme [Mycobacteriales bacterium]|nr:maleylpyruvate isomerase family mycothiol-dependent enzyme [Mycobacteriales bacterium]